MCNQKLHLPLYHILCHSQKQLQIQPLWVLHVLDMVLQVKDVWYYYHPGDLLEYHCKKHHPILALLSFLSSEPHQDHQF
jgi:hypothetical protein